MTWGIFKYNTFYFGAASFVMVLLVTLARLAETGNQQVPSFTAICLSSEVCCAPQRCELAVSMEDADHATGVRRLGCLFQLWSFFLMDT